VAAAEGNSPWISAGRLQAVPRIRAANRKTSTGIKGWCSFDNISPLPFLDDQGKLVCYLKLYRFRIGKNFLNKQEKDLEKQQTPE
jgi:hypothetical protein